MKLLVVGHTYIAPINREKWLALARQFPDDEITVVIPNEWPDALFTLTAGDCSAPLNNLTFEPLMVQRAGNEVTYGYRFRDLFRVMKKAKPDVLYVEQGDNAFSYFQALTVGKMLNPKLTISFFTWVNWKHEFGWKYRFFWHFLERFNLWMSDRAIVGNHEAEKILREKGFQKPILVLPQLGMEMSFLPSKKESTEQKKVCFVGRMVEEKGVALLLNAFCEIAKKHPDWNLYFVGAGPLKNKLEELVMKNDFSNRVFFLGSLSHEAVVEFLKNVDCMVLPSFDTKAWKEQFGHVLVEAMSLGVPVIGSTGGAIPWVIGDAGIIVEQQDEKALLQGLDEMLSDSGLREKYSQAGIERVKKKFTHEIIAFKTREFLQ